MFKLTINAGHGINTAGKRCLKSIDPAETREEEGLINPTQPNLWDDNEEE